MLTAFEQRAHDDVWITTWREADEPAILCIIFAVLVLGPQGQRDNLGGAGFPGDIDARNMRRRCCSLRKQYTRHGVGNECPAIGFDRYALDLGVLRSTPRSRAYLSIPMAGHSLPTPCRVYCFLREQHRRRMFRASISPGKPAPPKLSLWPCGPSTRTAKIMHKMAGSSASLHVVIQTSSCARCSKAVSMAG